MTLQVGVKAVLRNSEGKILLLKRSARYGVVEGTWDIPGGRIDAGSPLVENLARELKEEIGLGMVSAPKLIAAQDIFSKDGEKHIVRLTYVAEISGEPELDGKEHTEHQWAVFSDLSGVEHLDEYVAELLHDGRLTNSSWAP